MIKQSVDLSTGEITLDVEWVPEGVMGEAELLEQRRATAKMSMQAFCLMLLQWGILTPLDAEAAARGEWPSALAPMLEALPPEDAAAHRITWSTSAVIRRTHPLLAAVAAPENLNISDEDLDTLFGI